MATRDQLLDGALHHLNAHPATSMSELAAAIGVGRATLHRHFATRADLVRAIGERSMERWETTQATTGVREATVSDDADVVRECLRGMLAALTRDAEDFAFVLTDDSMIEDAGLLARMTALQAVEVELMVAGQRTGVLRSDVPAAWLSHLVYGVMVSVREALRAGDLAPRTAADVVVSTFLSGASA
ncbi:TetR/AcrR family transcriptional regulator [Nocardioides lianchengensis]|uniref:DNA-binding transcriptional regulator, AcrR family n=1 Tax=Nocardioides lianchengensis TaxID=1045774 RepID=A0A1G6MUL2_9ACTN|nr:TetR family transcriptional regulator [Nocardioides lianchengensis]NYG10532.1 AcrR family transcriptional regulator [Nocardioides lianchengensis]SDC58666.1 DNA-binding transcriptional regulator, AcrR family [Nocardioides lianchengensis]